jgi:hypothetical protein
MLLSAPVPVIALDRGAGIDAPAADSPARLAPGDTLELLARLRLPLTPPPGVQQPRIWRGWSVGLRRTVDRAAAGASAVLEYRFRPLRIRPAGENRYRLVAVVPPWLLGGTYDLLLKGPGIEGESREAVVVDDGAKPGTVIDVALPPGSSGVAVSLAGQPLAARAVALAGSDAEAGPIGGRVVRFGLPDFAGGPPRSGDRRETLARELELLPVGERSCGARVVLGPGSAVLAGDCGGIATYDGDPEALSVIWEIGRRATAAGRRVGLSCVADAGARLEAIGFDGHGRPCRAGLRVPARMPPATAGCGCVARPDRTAGLLRTLAAIFCLSAPAAREYDAAREPLTRGSSSFER